MIKLDCDYKQWYCVLTMLSSTAISKHSGVLQCMVYAQSILLRPGALNPFSLGDWTGSGEMGWIWGTHDTIRISYTTSCGKLRKNRRGVQPVSRCKVDIIIIIREAACEKMDRIKRTHNKVRWRAFVNTVVSVMNQIKTKWKILISNFRRVLIVLFFLLDDSPPSDFYVPTFRNNLFHLHRSCDQDLWRWNRQCVPKCRHIKFRSRGIT